MKRKILLLVSFLWVSFAVAQAGANMPPNIHQCGNEVFDLTVQTAVILGNQNPSQFSVTYFTSLSNAQTNLNPIANPSFYVSPLSQVIFARVTNSSNGTYATTSFTVSWSTGQGPFISPLPDVTACDAYPLPALSVGNYYTGPNGTGSLITIGTLITQTMMVYAYANQSGCSSQTSFMVTILGSPQVEVQNVFACTEFVLPALPAPANYFTGPGGTGTILAAGQTITQSMTLYVFAQNGSCTFENSFTVTIGEIQANNPNPIESCSADGMGIFDLTTVMPEVSSAPGALITFYSTMADAQADVNSILNVSAFVSPTSMLFIRVQIGDCFDIVPLQLISNVCTDNYIYGSVVLDTGNDGCGQGNDVYIPGIALTHTFGGQQTTIYTTTNSYLEIPNVQSGTNVIAVDPTSLPAGISVAEPTQTFDVGTNEQYDASFCATGVISPDTSIYIIPTSQPIPGFNATYRIGLLNMSLQNSTATVTVTFDNSKLTFTDGTYVPVAQTANTVTFSVPTIPALATGEFEVYFQVAMPPIANSGDVLTLTASSVISPADSNAGNNTISLEQTVTNSYDPNDITVHEGATITPAQADDYLHYTIRFQNLGTASAQNVRIENMLDANLDWSTFRPVSSSHFYRAERDGNAVVFYFDSIFLTAEQNDEDASHGYVSYKVKPISGIQVGDSVTNQAGIFFDFNPVVETNGVVTTVQMLSADDTAFGGISIYPNPTQDVFKVRALNVSEMSIEIIDARGAKVMSDQLTLDGNEASVDVSQLNSGLYFVRMVSGNASVVRKLMVR
ncbi:T9SS type A sorting domain-containing protein [Flavobacterium sp.]|uniref:T9SS type A sorting domain-containing protein n=1 Tax=Flavobacterium sp. TaxID=239 RepID=UPI0025BAB017|nr:T9SS type A sorting domain-containing protein [Flavobacterium sp.]